MRITLHAVAADDHPDFHQAMQATLRAARLNDGASADRADPRRTPTRSCRDLLAFAAERRTNAELDAWFEARFGALPKPGPWWALRSVAPVVHAPTGGPWSFGPRPAYVASPTGRPPARTASSRCSSSCGATSRGSGRRSIKDIASFGLLYVPTVRAALDGLGDGSSTLEGPGGTDVVRRPRRRPTRRATRRRRRG